MKQSGWIKKAKRRRRWRWLIRLIFKPRIKYYRLKRKLKTNYREIIGNS